MSHFLGQGEGMTHALLTLDGGSQRNSGVVIVKHSLRGCAGVGDGYRLEGTLTTQSLCPNWIPLRHGGSRDPLTVRVN